MRSLPSPYVLAVVMFVVEYVFWFRIVPRLLPQQRNCTIQPTISNQGFSLYKISTLHTEQRLLFYDKDSLVPIQKFGRNVLLYSAIISNSTNNKTWDQLSIHAWERANLTHQNYACCVVYQSKAKKKFSQLLKISRDYKEPALRAHQFICDLIGHDKDYVKIVSATLIENSNLTECPTDVSVYVKVDYTYAHPKEIAIFAKVIYDTVSASNLIAWLELHRLMGIHKVVFYPFRLHKNATKVLHYYQHMGLVEIVPFSFPTTIYYNRDIQRLDNRRVFFNHQEVSIMDGFERLKGYNYIVGIDIDEYLVPNMNETWMSLFDRLWRMKPDAAGFTFGTYIYTTSWVPTSNRSLFTVGRYLNRTSLTIDRNKHVVMPKRLNISGFRTHVFTPKTGFARYRVPETEAVVRHYRPCRPSYIGTTETCFQFKRFKDEHIYKVLNSIEKRVISLQRELGL